MKGDDAPFMRLPPKTARIIAQSPESTEEGLSFLRAWRRGELTGEARRLERDLYVLAISAGIVTGTKISPRPGASEPSRFLAEVERKGTFEKALRKLPPARVEAAKSHLEDAFRLGHDLGSKAPSLVRKGRKGASTARAAPTDEIETIHDEFFEILMEAPITGLSRSSHRMSANKFLANRLAEDPDFAQELSSLLRKSVLEHMQSGKSGFLNPPGTEWHHQTGRPGFVQLLRREAHRDKRLQDFLHKGGIGGHKVHHSKN